MRVQGLRKTCNFLSFEQKVKIWQMMFVPEKNGKWCYNGVNLEQASGEDKVGYHSPDMYVGISSLTNNNTNNRLGIGARHISSLNYIVSVFKQVDSWANHFQDCLRFPLTPSHTIRIYTFALLYLYQAFLLQVKIKSNKWMKWFFFSRLEYHLRLCGD